MKRILLSAALALVLGTLAWAQGGKPNFSGTWTLDPARADFGPMPPPESMVLVIEHKDPDIKVTSTQKSADMGEITNERRITTDGKENKNKLRTMMGDQDVVSTTTWSGTGLTSKYALEFQGNKVDVTDSWELSADGKVLTLVRSMKTDQGDTAMKLVFNKK